MIYSFTHVTLELPALNDLPRERLLKPHKHFYLLMFLRLKQEAGAGHAEVRPFLNSQQPFKPWFTTCCC